LGGTLIKALSGGTVSFGAGESVDINLIGSKTLNASDGTRNADSNAFTITHAAPASLAWTTQPTDPTVAGADISVAIELRDTFGNLVSTGAEASANVTLTKSAGTGTLGGTLIKPLSGGTVSFAAAEGVNIDLIGSKTLNADDGTRNADSNAFTIGHAPASSLVWTVQPSDPTIAGANITPTIVVRDSFGNLVSTGADATANITLSKQAGTGTLGGTLTKAAVGGSVSFGAGEAVNIDLIGSKTLRATKADTTGGGGTASFFTDSSAFTINHAAPNSLAWTTQPTDPTVAGADISVAIELRDTYGNLVSTGAEASANVTLTKSAGNGTLGGTLVKALSGGTVSFGAGESVDIDLIGSKTLNASDGTRNADSNAFTITHAAPASLAWTTQPTDPTVAGADINVALELRDTYGNLVSTGVEASANVTLTKSAGTGVLGGTLIKALSGGTVSFGAAESVDINLIGSKTLNASDGTRNADSNAFTITHAAPASLAWTTQPTDPTVAGADINVALELRDTYGNLVSTGAEASANVTLTKSAGTGTLGGTLIKAFSGGTVSFAAAESVDINLIGSKTLNASDGTRNADSNAFTITHAAPASLAWTTQPTDPTVAGADINVALELRDTYGNLVSTGAEASANVTLTKSAGTGTLGGTLIKALSGGTVSFAAAEGVNIDLIGSKTLNADDGTRNADSNAFTIGHAPASSLVWTVQPSDPTVAGANITPTIEVRDSFGNLVSTGADATANITLSKQAGTGTLGGTLVKAASGGSVSFGAGEAVNIDLVGSKTLRATKADTTGSGGTISFFTNSNAFTINHAPASQIVYTTSVTDPTAAGADIVPVLEIRDPYGNPVTTGADATANVTLSLQAGTGTLGGTLTKAAASGVATFTATEGVNIDLAGAKTLRATKADTTGGGGTVAAFVDDGFNISLPSAPTSITLFDPGSEPSNDTTPTFTVGGVSNGYTIKLYTNNTCTSGVIGSGVSGGASVNVTVAPPLTTGTYDIYATQTDTYTNESACTTVFYDDYDLDATPPNPATGGALASAWAASSATSPQFSWTASGSGDVDHYEVALGTSVGGTTATGGWVNPSDTSTTHIFTSLTLTECSGGTPVYYPSVRVHDTVGNISTELNYGSGFRWDNTNPGAPGVPDVSAGDAEATKSPTTTWTAGTDNCELSHYQMAIGTTSGGTDIQGFTNIGNVTSYQAVNGVGGFTLALSPGIYYYTTIRTVDSSGKVSSTQTSSQWRYIVAPDAVSDLAYASRTTTTVEMSWTAPNNNGTPITDYLIEYKETSSGTWLNFDDGVSAGTTATVT
ncbi:MAG: fibronectin type III domain-containing protein, partial [Bdellovibrionales bacterium]|nr:fibronectin type III domain-containing protein [Bdellovibrionales bacterium]